MSRIVVLVGSVRREGNTALLAKAFAEGAGKRHEVELVYVADYSIHPCLGYDYRFDGVSSDAAALCKQLMNRT